jgi:hypothetical protein
VAEKLAFARLGPIAEYSGGKTCILDGSDAVLNMIVMAIIERMKGAPAVESYIVRYL